MKTSFALSKRIYYSSRPHRGSEVSYLTFYTPKLSLNIIRNFSIVYRLSSLWCVQWVVFIAVASLSVIKQQMLRFGLEHNTGILTVADGLVSRDSADLIVHNKRTKHFTLHCPLSEDPTVPT